MTVLEQAYAIREAMDAAGLLLTDEQAIKCKAIYKQWSELIKVGKVDTNGEPGYRFLYGAELYKCNNGDPTFQEDWIPGIYTSALYVRIDEAHAGTKEDPIPADRGMEYIYGKYYLDPEDGKTYICHRTGANEGDTIQLAYLPHELIGHYFVEA